LKGKVVVLEFWATWCGPCIAAIPHLNELADRFKDKPVQFIAITAEDEQVAGPFLKKKPIHAWVGLDTDKLMSKAYGIEAIPHTVVVDREGKIAAVTHPTMLTEQHLEDVLAGKKLALAQPNLALAKPVRGGQAGFRPGELPGGAQQGREALPREMAASPSWVPMSWAFCPFATT
jgi:thiol-disulfide isomerase/thioredoxin